MTMDTLAVMFSLVAAWYVMALCFRAFKPFNDERYLSNAATVFVCMVAGAVLGVMFGVNV